MIKGTEIELHLQKAIELSDTIAWFDAHSDEVKDSILDLIRQEQLFEEGIDEEGQIIGYYSRLTEELSGGSKKAGDPYTLKDTGQFYRSMVVKVLNDSIVIDANYTKMEDQKWWKIGILGLTEDNLEKYAEMVRENFILYAREVLDIN
jgi:hypothetical protein